VDDWPLSRGQEKKQKTLNKTHQMHEFKRGTKGPMESEISGTPELPVSWEKGGETEPQESYPVKTTPPPPDEGNAVEKSRN